MKEAIMALTIAVRDGERSVERAKQERDGLEREISQLSGYFEAAHIRYLDAADWLDGLVAGLEALEEIEAKNNGI